MSTEQSESPDMSSVRVAVRIRPQSARERIEFCRVCTTVTPGEPQLLLGNDRAFTFDFVFNSDASQGVVFENCAKPLILSCLNGYNSTIFAYGQTGSGKTYTMGTGFEVDQRQCDIGIIPRAVDLLFSLIRERRAAALSSGVPVPEFQVQAQFLELYNEEVYDLFSSSDRDVYAKRTRSSVKIHESSKGEIFCENVTTRHVNSLADTMECLRLGSLARATASTNMNAQSSRSHAIFTLYIRQQRAIIVPSIENANGVAVSSGGSETSNPSPTSNDAMVVSNGSNGDAPEFEILTAKFHFVDLAGSERLKRTGATGERAREGISINCGLLALGNVISALGDTARHCSHVPYRDSKLTRILQDSLGGNSCTVMVACISPSDCDFVETLNTLKYANRARNIRNKVTVNQDKTSAVISALRAEIIQLKQELLEFKQGKRFVDADGSERHNDVDKENALLLRDNDLLRRRIHALQETIEQLTESNARMMVSIDVEKLVKNGVGEATNGAIASVVPMEQEVTNADASPGENGLEAVVLRYAREMERLRAQLQESQGLCRQLLQRNGSVQRSANNTPRPISAALPLSSSFASPAVSNFLGTPNSAALDGKGALHQETTLVNGLSNTVVDGGYSMYDTENDDVLLDEARAKLARLQQQQLIMQGSSGSDGANNGALDASGCAESTDDELGCTITPADQQQEVAISELGCEISEIQKQINVQQQLIERLEQSQLKIASMRQQYEAKVGQLQAKIRETEAERDRVLNNVERTEALTKDRSEQLRVDYEAKINMLQVELKKVQATAREFTKNQAKQAENERKLEQLRSELLSMKQAKTALVRRLRDESLRQRKAEAEKNREIANLRRQQQQKDSVIQRLEAEKRMREIVSRRQQEEAEALRRRQQLQKRTANSTRANVTSTNQTQVISATVNYGAEPVVVTPSFTDEESEEVWQTFITRLNHLVAGRSLLNRTDCELKRLLSERETLNQRLQRYLRQRGHVNSSPLSRNSGDIIADLEAQIDNLKANIRYNEDSIDECQRRIIQLVSPADWADQPQVDDGEEGAGSGSRDLYDGEVDIKKMLAGSGSRVSAVTKSSEILRFILDKLMNAFITQGVSLSRLEVSSKPAERPVEKELVSRLYPVNSNLFEGELVPTADAGLNGEFIPSKLPAAAPVANGQLTVPDESAPLTPRKTVLDVPSSQGTDTGFLAVSNRSAKARRWSATTQELLFGRPSIQRDTSLNVPSGMVTTDQNVTLLAPLVENEAEQDSRTSAPMDSSSDAVTGTLVETQPNVADQNGWTSSVPQPIPSPSSPTAAAKYTDNLTVSQLSNSSESENVFHRLSRGSRRGSSEVDTSSDAPMAVISQMPGKIRASSSSLLNSSSSFNTSGTGLNTSGNGARISATSSSPCFSPFEAGAPIVEYVAQASGHSRTVLSVTGDSQGLLFTGSKDRTAKAWDLTANAELFTLTGHPDSVVRVLYSQTSRLLFTVAGACVRVWDCRCFDSPVAELENPATTCICRQTLVSSGLSMEGAGSRSELMRMVRGGGITDAALLATPATELLMSSANADVRVWDLRNFNSMAKLIAPGSGQSTVMSLCTTPQPYSYVFTGSRDHLVRLYDLSNAAASGSIAPRLTFEPPHCDTVQALAFTAGCPPGRMVTFSGSRDGCLKKWEWDTETSRASSDVHVQVLSNAHRAGISSLATIPWLVDSDYQDQILVSTGRDGTLRIWNASPEVPLSPLAEVTNAHPQPITAVAGATTANGVFVYTASQDRHVRIWRLTTKD